MIEKYSDIFLEQKDILSGRVIFFSVPSLFASYPIEHSVKDCFLFILLGMVILLCFVYLYLSYSSQIIRQLCFLCLHKGCQRWLKNSICVDQVGIRSAESSTMNTGLLCFSNAFPYSLFLQLWTFIFTGDLQNAESNRVCIHCPATEPRSYMKAYTLLVLLVHHDEIVLASLGDL